MSRQPAGKVKSTGSNSATTARPYSTSKDAALARKLQDEEDKLMEEDERVARQLQEELLQEQAESDAEMARRLHEEDRQKMPPPMRHYSRPVSATPIHQLFRNFLAGAERPVPSYGSDTDEDEDPIEPAGAAACSAPITDQNSREGGAIERGSRGGGATGRGFRGATGGRLPPRGQGRAREIATDQSSEQTNSRGGATDRGSRGGATDRGSRGGATDRDSRVGGAIGREIRGATGGRLPPRGRDRAREIATDQSSEQTNSRSPETPVRIGRGIARRSSNSNNDSESLSDVQLNPLHTRYRGPPSRFVLRGGPLLRTIEPEDAADPLAESGYPLRRDLTQQAFFDLHPLGSSLPEDEYDPDFLLLDTERNQEENFVGLMRNPFLLMVMLMGRDPGFMIPDDIDPNDYEALWDLAERVGEVKSPGMTDEDINKLPVKAFLKRGGKNCEEECRVCLTEYQSGEQVNVLPCLHEFHQKCIKEWLKRNASCPICRYDVNSTGTPV